MQGWGLPFSFWMCGLKGHSQFQKLFLKKMAASTSCLFKFSLLEPNPHVVRKHKQPVERPIWRDIYGGNCEDFSLSLSWSPNWHLAQIYQLSELSWKGIFSLKLPSWCYWNADEPSLHSPAQITHLWAKYLIAIFLNQWSFGGFIT